MAIEANQIHRRVVMFFHASQAHPEQTKYMRPELKTRVDVHAHTLIPLLAQVGDDVETDAIEQSYAATHDLVMRIHDGCRYQYAKKPEMLAKLAPLTVGADPATNQIRLSHLLTTLGPAASKFMWLPDCTEAEARKILAEHIAARALDESLTNSQRSASKTLRELRPESTRLWEEDGGLDIWIRANIVGHESQLAWGRERRARPRQAKKGTPAKNEKNETPPKNEATASPPSKPEPPPGEDAPLAATGTTK